MKYCSACQLLSDASQCPACGGRLREPESNDPVLLAVAPPFEAEVFTPILKNEDIPFSAMSNLGSGFTAEGGHLLEEISIYVPYAALDKARELWEGFKAEAPQQGTAE